MNLSELLGPVKDIPGDVQAFLPEVILCGAIVLLLILRLFSGLGKLHLGGLALVLTVAALAVSWAQWQGNTWGILTPADFYAEKHSANIFSGLLAFDNFTVFLRLFLLGFTSLVIWLTLITGIPDAEDSADFYCLLLGAVVGMSLMASANHLLMVFLGVEMASVPSYALAGFLKGRRQSSEAALKYVVYGGAAAGIMLYGISLLAGRFGTAYLPDVGAGYIEALGRGGGAAPDLILLLGTLFIIIGIGFKLAAVPFHFWCPDVFEGASAEVAGFLSVASKGAALALLARLSLTLVGVSEGEPSIELTRFLVPALAIFAAVTATFGNLAAYLQTNLKRLLAYSTIAHAGYMMMGLAVLSARGTEAVLFYLIVYLFMNLGAFAVVAFLRNQTGSEDLSSYRGIVRQSPWMTITLVIFLLSLLGLPPLAGFAAKFQIFRVLFEEAQSHLGKSPHQAATLYTLLVIGGLNTVISLVYYIKVAKVMILDTPVEETEGRPAAPLQEPAWSVLYAGVIALVVLGLGVWWNGLAQESRNGVQNFQPGQASSIAPLSGTMNSNDASTTGTETGE